MSILSDLIKRLSRSKEVKQIALTVALQSALKNMNPETKQNLKDDLVDVQFAVDYAYLISPNDRIKKAQDVVSLLISSLE